MTDKTLSVLPNNLGSARFIGRYETGSEEWHYLRRLGIGGSDISSIVGCNPWSSAYHLAAVRLGKIEDTFKGNEATEWGHLLEPVIIDKFESKHDYTVHRDVGTWHSEEHPFQLANPDAVLYRDGEYAILEIKTARYEDDWKVPASEDELGDAYGVPPYYRTQVQWYLQTFGFKRAYVAVLFSGSKYREYLIEADPFEQTMNFEQAQEFWKLLCSDTLPEFSQPYLSTYTAVRQMHPDIEDETTELGSIGTEYLQAIARCEEADSQLDLARAAVMQAMGKSKRGAVNGKVVVTRQSRNGGTPYLVSKGR